MKHKKRWLSAALLGAVMCSLLTGCGGGNDEAAQAETAGEDGLTHLSLQLSWLPQGEFMGYYVAQSKGYYADEGLEVEILPGSSDVSPAEQVENGVVQLGNGFYTDILSYREAGYDLINVAQWYQDSPLYLVSKKSAGINSPADLKGKRIGSWFGGQQYEIYALLGKYGIDRDNDVEWVQQDFTMDAFYNDQLDAASAMSYNEYHLVLDNGYSADDLNVINMNDEGVNMYEDCLFVDREWAEANSDTLTAFIRATVKGWRDACADPEEAGQICWDAGQSVSLQHQIDMCTEAAKAVCPEDIGPDKIGWIDPEEAQKTIDLGCEYTLLNEQVDYTESVDTSYWEAAVAE